MAKKSFFIFLSIILAVSLSYFLVIFDQVLGAIPPGIAPQGAIPPASTNEVIPNPSEGPYNVSGFAWSENIGWISFNSKNCDTNNDGKSDGNENLPGCPPAGKPIPNYGVNVDSDGRISGYAWSENIGWIFFNNFQECPSGRGSCEPQLNRSTGEVSGWARACAGTKNGECSSPSRDDWDGWIHLKGKNYGVSVSGCNWDGWAWGSDVVGWIHFRNDSDGDGIVNTDTDAADYGVLGSGNACANTNAAPSASNLSVSQPDYCNSGPAGIFSWTFSDLDQNDHQSAYQIQVASTSDFSSLEVDSTKVASDSNSYATPPGKLKYNTTYYWRLMVWDSKDASSTWISGPPFTTPRHAYPSVDFVWSSNPAPNQVVQFTDNSTCSNSYCNSWRWTFQDGNPPTSSQQNATTTFASSGQKQVTLVVTDSDNFSCTGSKTVNISDLCLPQWREIAPSSE